MKNAIAGAGVAAAILLSLSFVPLSYSQPEPDQPREQAEPENERPAREGREPREDPREDRDRPERRDERDPRDDRDAGEPGFRREGGRGFGGPGFGGPGFGGPPGFREERKLVAKHDSDRNGWLNAEERTAARKELSAEPNRRGGPGFGGPGPGGRGRRGGPGFFRGPAPGRENREPAKPGERIAPADAATHPQAELYDPTVLRTLFLEFENTDWEQELADFNNTDVEVPAKLVVDGKEYANVGVHFRGMSSFMGVPAGYKRSLNLSLDFINKDQRLGGYRTLNLLNAHEDDSLMSSVLYSHIARQYLPTPKANFVRVVINGENWGVYANLEQFNKDFIKENFHTEEGARWKVNGSPGADGGLRYLGDEIEPYRERFTIKSKDEERAWRDLIALCRTLEETPPEKLEAALEPRLDIDGALRFLALDVALVNMDGYWVRASDYSLYQDPSGKFHLIASDMNEAFRGGGGPRGGPGMRGRRGRGGPPEDEPQRRRDRADGNTDDRNRPDRRRDNDPEAEAARNDRPSRDLNRDEPDAERDRRRPEPGDRELADDERRDFGPPPEFGPPDGPPGFGPPGGPPGFGPGRFGPPGFGGPGGRGGPKLDPLVGLENDRTPLRTKLLAVPALRARYLQYVHDIAENSLDWNKLGPVLASYRELIREEVERDTRKLSSYEAFLRMTADEKPTGEASGREIGLRAFADQRREYLLKQTEKELADKPAGADSKDSAQDDLEADDAPPRDSK